MAELSEDRKGEIISVLTANSNTRAGRSAWAHVDLNECSDDELLAFNELNSLLAPVENDIACPCGRRHVWNESKTRWEAQGTPKNQKMPATIAEFIAAGGGTSEDREAHDFSLNHLRDHKSQLLEAITANMDDSEREAAWTDYSRLPLTELEKMAKRFGRTQTQNSGRPPYSHEMNTRFGSGMFGQQGQPANSQFGGIVSNEQALEVPPLTFENVKKRGADRGTA